MNINLTDWERLLIVDALRKALKDPMTMESLNSARHDIINKLQLEKKGN